MLNDHKIIESDLYVAYKVTGHSDHRYIVYRKVPMNNLPGCKLGFKQEVYRSRYRTKKLYSFFGV